MKDRIIAYLSQGFEQVQVVSMTGASAAYVSEIAKEAAVEIAAEKEKHKKHAEEQKIEEGYVRLETKIQKAMEQNLPFAEFADLTRAMGLLLQRRQKPVPAGIVHDNRQQFIMLSVPHAAVPEFVLNERKEVIAVGNKSLAPLSAPAVRALFDKLAQAKLPVEHASLPSSRPQSEDTEDAVILGMPSDF
jgi:hypothetical protein